uniref:Uncharacterized protein n=1 Tax=Arundo donax TaxID=35708 RepID=A0A0A9H0B2_ARUDO
MSSLRSQCRSLRSCPPSTPASPSQGTRSAV